MTDGRTTLMILALIQFGLGTMGYHSGFENMMNDWFGGFGLTNLPLMLGAIMIGITAATGAGVAASFLSSNFGVIYAIPALIGQTVILILFLTPISFLTEGPIPYPVNFLLDIIFGIMVMFTVISFVRGGEL